MPAPPGNNEKFVVSIAINGPLTNVQLDKVKEMIKKCAAEVNGSITENRVEER